MHTDTDSNTHSLAPASLQAAMGALNMLTDRSPNSKRNDKFLPQSLQQRGERDSITPVSYKQSKGAAGGGGGGGEEGGEMPRKQATPVFKKKKDESNAVGRRTTYHFLSPKVETQLLESRWVFRY
jgi:hypothetical protein